jgi:hypothetical protein
MTNVSQFGITTQSQPRRRIEEKLAWAAIESGVLAAIVAQLLLPGSC